jgi:hypothetical protein
MRTSCHGENLPGVYRTGSGEARGRYFFLEDVIAVTSLFVMLLNRAAAMTVGAASFLKALSWIPRHVSQSRVV